MEERVEIAVRQASAGDIDKGDRAARLQGGAQLRNEHGVVRDLEERTARRVLVKQLRHG